MQALHTAKTMRNLPPRLLPFAIAPNKAHRANGVFQVVSFLLVSGHYPAAQFPSRLVVLIFAPSLVPVFVIQDTATEAVRWFNDIQGVGRIVPDQDLAHFRAIQATSFNPLKEEQEVTFDVAIGARRASTGNIYMT